VIVRQLVIFLATWGWVGYAPVAPGTVGTLAAVPLFPLLAVLRQASMPAYLVAVVLGLAGAVWVSGAACSVFGEHDSSRIVIDEVAGYVVATALLDFSWFAAGLAFCLFRLFDILKPFPASWVDRHVGGGLGVVGDDVVAGVFAGIVARILLCLL
jgi:phosphatidylglycerophosphatase A